jgi:hypothetical protein
MFTLIANGLHMLEILVVVQFNRPNVLRHLHNSRFESRRMHLFIFLFISVALWADSHSWHLAPCLKYALAQN